MVGIVFKFTSVGFSWSPNTWRPVAGDSAGIAGGPRPEGLRVVMWNCTSQEDAYCLLPGSEVQDAHAHYAATGHSSFADVLGFWLFPTVPSSGLTSTYLLLLKDIVSQCLAFFVQILACVLIL
jgi:hypothetical protein